VAQGVKRSCDLAAVILAGGQGSRMGGVDKGLQPLAGRPMVSHVLQLVDPLVDQLVVSCNRSEAQYSELCDYLVADQIPGFPGPLAVLQSAIEQLDCRQLLVLPCDTPLLGGQVLERLLEAAREDVSKVWALSDSQYLHPLHAVLPGSASEPLERFLQSSERAVRRFYMSLGLETVTVPEDLVWQLDNINTPEQLAQAEQRLEVQG